MIKPASIYKEEISWSTFQQQAGHMPIKAGKVHG